MRRWKHHVMVGEETDTTAKVANSHRNPSGAEGRKYEKPFIKSFALKPHVRNKTSSFDHKWSKKCFPGVCGLLVCCFLLLISQSNRAELLHLESPEPWWIVGNMSFLTFEEISDAVCELKLKVYVYESNGLRVYTYRTNKTDHLSPNDEETVDLRDSPPEICPTEHGRCC